MNPTLLFLVTALVLPLLLSELGDWCPWLAERLVRWSARRLGDPAACERYQEEWAANLHEVPGKISRLAAAFGYFAYTPRLRRTLRRTRRATAASRAAARDRLSTQLPAPIADFVGRSDETGWLTKLMATNNKLSSRVGVISGMAGIGKTALALHAAHQLADRFPDGQLYLSLCDYDPREPRSAHEALGALLREGLGVPAGQIPDRHHDRIELYRQTLAGARSLIILDDAADSRQVRPLLPGTPGCLVLITSRSRLTGLEDADRLTLEPLPAKDAIALFGQIAGGRATNTDDSRAIEQLASLCGYLPLAIHIAARLVRTRPSTTPGQLLKQLTEESDLWTQLSRDRSSSLEAK